MKYKTFKAALTLFNWFMYVFSGYLFAQSQPYRNSIEIKHIEAEGIGYSEGYSTFKSLNFIKSFKNNTLIFVDSALHVFDHFDLAANFGLGSRLYLKNQDVYFGINSYLDYRSAINRKYHFTAVGLGLEVLHSHFDFRINASLPLVLEKTIHRCHFNHYLAGFWVKKTDELISLKGGNIEIGAFGYQSFPFSLYLSAGTYYYKGGCVHALGGMARLKMTFNQSFYVEGVYQNDNLYNTRIQGVIGVTLPLGSPVNQFLKSSQKVQRPEIIPLYRGTFWDCNY